MRMKIWMLGGIAAISLIVGLAAQDGPNSQSSQTVAPRRKAPAPDTGNNPGNTPADDADLPKIPSKLSPKATKDNDAPSDATFKAETNIVNIDVQVIDNNGNPIPNIPRGNFRILEDNVPQTLTQFAVGEAPMTVALVVEFSAKFEGYGSAGWFDTLNASYGFVQSLKPEDYLAIIAYDLHSTILSDFTNDRSKTSEALSRLRIPGFSEANMFDAITDTADRMSKIEGRKAILLIASGIDTFSKINYDQARKSLQESGVPVYSIETLQVMRIVAEARMGASTELSFLQGDNELRTFAKETGGQAFFPRFPQELPNVFRAISQALRTEYSLGYSPNNQAKDGKFRKITVQLVNPGTNEPMRMLNEKGKPLKYTVIAKAGYKGPRAVE
jgi:Ca-activated chloride channel family protein